MNNDYNNKYQKENLKQIKFKLNKKTDKDILDHLEKQENVQGYLKSLVRAEMSKK